MTVPIRATYIWLGGVDTYKDIRSKDKTVYVPEEQAASGNFPLENFGIWNYDGSSTGQAKGENTEVLLKPSHVAPYPDSKPPRVVVVCETFFSGEKGLNPTPSNTRARARAVFEASGAPELKPTFGLEQEYVLLKNDRPLGWPERGFPAPQGPYYCGNGADRTFGREIIDTHYNRCLLMGLKVSGTNAEVMPGQWEFQVGPAVGLEAGDHLLLARWLYLRVLEEFSVRDNCIYTIDYEPKPIKGDWNGSGMHCNFSTADTMNKDKGMATIKGYIENLNKTYQEDIKVYGSNNEERLSGKHETSRIDQFSFGVGTRHTSIRIPNDAEEKGWGYFEDRRPAGNADPYLITSQLFSSSTGIKPSG